MVKKDIILEMQQRDANSSSSSAETWKSLERNKSAKTIENTESCCSDIFQDDNIEIENLNHVNNVVAIQELSKCKDDNNAKHCLRDDNNHNSYASNKNVAEGLMDIALLSANANQLRFLITYNHEASTYYISLGLIALSLTMQVFVGIALIYKRRMKRCNNRKRFTRTNEFIVGGVFMVTVVNILLAALTTTDGK